MKNLVIAFIYMTMILVIGIMLWLQLSPEIITFTVICAIGTRWFIKQIK